MKTGIKTALCLVFAIVLVSVAGTSRAKELYSWTDENGTVHFSDTKPAGQDFKTEKIPDDSPSVQADPAPPAADTETLTPGQERRQEIAEQKRQARENQAERDAQCAAWQAEVQQLEPNRRVFMTNEDGETERMDDVVRTDRVAQLKAQIARDCN